MHTAELPQDDLGERCIGGGVSERHNGNERISLKIFFKKMLCIFESTHQVFHYRNFCSIDIYSRIVGKKGLTESNMLAGEINNY